MIRKERFELIFNRAAERASTVLYVEALLNKMLFGIIGNFKADRLGGHTLLQDSNHIIKDAANVLLRQSIEGHDRVEAIHEFRLH